MLKIDYTKLFSYSLTKICGLLLAMPHILHFGKSVLKKDNDGVRYPFYFRGIGKIIAWNRFYIARSF